MSLIDEDDEDLVLLKQNRPIVPNVILDPEYFESTGHLDEYEEQLSEEFVEDNDVELTELSQEQLDNDLSEMLEREITEYLENESRIRQEHLNISVVRKGNSIIVTSALDRLTQDDITYLLTKEEKDKLAEENMALIGHMASKYLIPDGPYEYDDLFGVAQIGFTKALNNYDYTSSVPFHNYACFTMENVLRTYVDVEKRQSKLGIVTSIDSDYHMTPGSTLQDVLIDPTQESVEDIVSSNLVKDIVCELCDVMPKILEPKEEFMIKSYYGLDDVTKMTKGELANFFNESTRQINNVLDRAYKKLRLYIQKGL